MALRDARGLRVGTASAAALDAAETALWRMMSFYGMPLDDLDAAIAADPGWLLPRVMKAGFLLGLTEPSLVGEGLAQLAAAAALAPGAEARERGHLAAWQAVAAGDWPGANAVWGELLERHPRDALALQWAHLFDFYRGDEAMLGERAARVLPAWSASDPLHPYVLAHHAFGLEENGRHDEAETVGRQALSAGARVPWAIHAVAHVMEMQGRHDDGSAWLHRWRADWAEGNGFAGHLAWHEALFALERLDHAAALAAFDRHLHPGATEITLQRVDAASLLWRLQLHGADVGPRWQALADGWSLDTASAGHSAFNDVHGLLALIGSEQVGRAEAWVGEVLAAAEQRPGWNRRVVRELGGPLMHALLAFAHGRWDDAARALAALRPVSASLGGSRAQRDVIDQTLLAAAARGSLAGAGRDLLAMRAGVRRATPLGDWWARALAAPQTSGGFSPS